MCAKSVDCLFKSQKKDKQIHQGHYFTYFYLLNIEIIMPIICDVKSINTQTVCQSYTSD